MTPTKDDRERARALTDLDATLLVEASAGTGKTSLLAGRVVLLLADNRAASSIAAITFTERAAAELRSRVETFADLLIEGKVPDDLAPAFRTRQLEDTQRANLREHKDRLGELTAGTIHAFCLSILQTYSVEARLDPGATVMDAEQTKLAFESILDTWLSERLSDTADVRDPIVVIAAEDPARAVKTLRALASFRREHPKARPLPGAQCRDAVHDFIDAVADYRRWISSSAAPDRAMADVEAFEELAGGLTPALSGTPGFGELLRLLHPDSRLLPVRKPDYDDSRVLFAYRSRLGEWRKLSDAVRGVSLSEEDQRHYDRCAALFGQAMGSMADALLGQYFGATDALMRRYEEFKLDAALLDFDDILIRTHALLFDNEPVRHAVAERYRHVLVDEFQDTDPIQTEILFLICGDRTGALRKGGLFLVGDPKQAIYRFRGADLDTYLKTCRIIAEQFPGNVLRISANFRSEQRILSYVDRVFETRLRGQLGDYGILEHTIEDPHSPAVRRHSYPTQQTDGTLVARQAEAREVADLCDAIVGNVEVRRSNGSIGRAEPGDIALLSPSRTQLWLYERALENKGLPVASQAGKNLYRRQETQDLVALVRALADNRDTLALGAVLRGPLVGFTEAELLDVTQALRSQDDGAVLRLRKNGLLISHNGVRAIMDILQELWRKRRGTTPHALLAEALDRLRAVPTTALRSPDQRSRALANLASILERARGYAVRGLKQFAIDLSGEWEQGVAFDEAPGDHPRDSIDIVTIHKAKGLEWPIVIPINLISMWRPRDEFFHRAEDKSLHWTLGDVASSSLATAIAADAAATRRENERLLYVAATRALDVLIIPDPSAPRPDSWFSFFDLGQAGLAPFTLPSPAPRPVRAVSLNPQTADIFIAESTRIAELAPELVWVRPSGSDVERELLDRIAVGGAENDGELVLGEPVVGAGARRGVILHRLMEELIAGLCAPEAAQLKERAASLILETADDGGVGPLPEELATTALVTFTHRELTPFRRYLVAEYPLYGVRSANLMISARADAVAFKGDRAVGAFDWKSDVAPSEATRKKHKRQLAEYLQLIDAPLGAVIYMTGSEWSWIDQQGNDAVPPPL